MTHPLTTGCLLLSLLAGAGCASVPEVESRLRTLQFHPNMYVVQAGDTLESIAYRYRLSPDEIAGMNPAIGERLRPGLRINVRPGTELPDAVRTRSGGQGSAVASAGGGSGPSEPLARAAMTAGSNDASRVVVSPVASRPPLPEPTGGIVSARTDTARYSADDGRYADATLGDDELLYGSAPGYPREEIVADDIDIGSGSRRAALDEELQRYVGRWTWPTDGAVARGFAPGRPNGQGVDIAGVPGQDVRAALDGTIVYSGRDLSGGGNLVIVRHDDDLMTTYSHADRLFVAEDDEVLAGDPIASLGWNEKRESVLRFEVRRDGEPLDPMTFLPSSP